MPNYNRGEVWVIDLGYAAKIRPCLILSIPANDDERALVTIVGHTTQPRGTDFEIDVDASFLKTGVFDAQNIVTVPHSKLVRKIGALNAFQLDQVERAVLEWLGF